MITMWKPHKLSKFWTKTLFSFHPQSLGTPQHLRDLNLAPVLPIFFTVPLEAICLLLSHD